MAILRGATISQNKISATTQTLDTSHTVDVGSTLLLVYIALEGNEFVGRLSLPQWSLGGGEDLTLIQPVGTSLNAGDCKGFWFGLLNPTAGAGTISIETESNVNPAWVGAVNYSGVVTTSLGDAVIPRGIDVNNAGTGSTVLSITGMTSGNAIVIGAHFQGADGNPASNNRSYDEVFNDTTGTSNNADFSVYMAEDLSVVSDLTVTISWSSTDENVGGALELVVPPPETNQEAFRFVNDDGNESGSTFAAALNTDLTGARDTIFRCRIQLSNPGDSAESADTFKPQKSIDGGAFTDLLDTGIDVRSVLSGNYTDNTVTTERLAGTGTFVAGEMLEGATPVTGSITLGGGEDTEIEFAFDCTGLKGAQTVDFRLTRVTGGPPDNLPEIPRFTVASTAVQTILRTSFATPTSPPLLGVDKQKFRLHVRRDAANSGTGTPTVDLFLYEGGVQRQALATGISITSDSGQTIEDSWDAANLVTADGSGVELRAVGNVGGSGIQARTVEFGAVEWCVEHEAAGAGSFVGQGTLGTLPVTGLVAAIIHGEVNQGTAGTVSVTGLAGEFQTNFVGQGTAGTVTIAGFVATVSHGHVVQGASGTLPVSGFGGSLIHGWSEQGPPATVTLTGLAGSITEGDILQGTEAHVNVTGFAGQFQSNFVAQGTAGTVTVSGFAGQFQTQFVAQGALGAVTITGLAGTFENGAADFIDQGTFGNLTVSGNAGQFQTQFVAQGTAGAVTVTGGVSTLSHGHVAQGTAATVTANGQVAAIIHGQVNQGSTGLLTVTGGAGSITEGDVLQGTEGHLNVTGFAGDFASPFTQQGTAGSVTITGFAGQFQTAFVEQGAAAAVPLTGLAGNLNHGQVLQGVAGTLGVSGFAGSFIGGDSFAQQGTAGTLTVAGGTGTIDNGHVIQGTVGPLTVTGGAGSITEGDVLQGLAGQLTVSGGVAALVLGVSIQGTAGNVTVSGFISAIAAGAILQGAAGAVTVTGFAGTFTTGAAGFTGQGTAGALAITGRGGVFCNDLFVPDTIAAMTGVTGVVGDVTADDGNWLVAV